MEIATFEIAGIIGMVFSGVNFIIVTVIKYFWKLTFERMQTELRELREEYHEDKEKNTSFRHAYKSAVDGLAVQIDHEIKSMNLKLDLITKSLNIDVKLDYIVQHLKDKEQ